ncbi:MAG: glycosyltransferase family 4 protein [Candidatus Eisenbacteria bacterium]|uniref:Glycosyltransferase family 4 protein n=1 Tax=Eiseniibacteriota bacterium TaxID=2212470 RepID=A0A7Y2EAG7_UNCEI|nr:glycosyltransferase family 4 protein [Candidatus Eisenbacteria bacterium]
MGYKICLVSYRDMKHPEAGGAEVIIEEVFGRLAEQGHEVTLLTGSFPGCKQRDRIGAMDIHRTGSTYTFNFDAPRYFKKHLEPQGFDLVAEDINKIPFFMPKHTKVPVLAIVPHLFGTTVFQQASFPIAAYVYLYERFIPRVYKKSMFSVLSGTTHDDLLARGIPKEHLRIIHSGMDHDLYKPSPIPMGDRPKRLVYLGRLKKYKGIELPILALPEVVKKVPDVEYWIVGEGDYRDALERIAKDHGVADHVKFPGFVGGQDKVELLQNSRVLVYTSPKEGWGLSVIEAGACECAVIASNSPGLKESVVDGKNGFLVPHGDVPALTEKMLKLLETDELAATMAKAGVEWAAEFNWENTTQKTLALIEEIISGEKRS